MEVRGDAVAAEVVVALISALHDFLVNGRSAAVPHGMMMRSHQLASEQRTQGRSDKLAFLVGLLLLDAPVRQHYAKKGNDCRS